MSQCYLCGEEMIDAGLKGEHPGRKFTHGEHIIPNALRGKLISDSILCLTCGNILNEQVDAGFVKYFSPVTEQLKKDLLKKDHGADNGANRISGFLYNEKFGQLEVDFKDYKVLPKREPPLTEVDDEKKTIKAYTTQQRGKHYKNVLAKSFAAEGKNIEEYSFEIIDDISKEGYLFFPAGLSQLEATEQNMALFLGLNKIATEFALAKGISREQLTRTLDIANQAIIYTDNIIPYVALGALESYREVYRPDLETDYPTHTLILFIYERRNGNKSLYCYVDLFSTFQFYVILNENFNENFYAEYYQTVMELEKPVIDVRKIRQKFLRPLISMLPIDRSVFNGKSAEEIIDILEKDYPNMPVAYEQNLEEELSKFIEHISHVMNIADGGLEDMAPNPLPALGSIEYLMMKSQVEDVEDLMERVDAFSDDPAYKDVLPCLYFYKQLFKYVDPDEEYKSIPHELGKWSKHWGEQFEKYSHFKYFQLTEEINARLPKEEAKKL